MLFNTFSQHLNSKNSIAKMNFLKKSRSIDNSFNPNIPKGLDLLSGEEYKDKCNVTYISPYNGNFRGSLLHTNFRFFFETICDNKEDKGSPKNNLNVPLACIDKMKVLNVFNKNKTFLLSITCKDMRKIMFEYDDDPAMKNFLSSLRKFAFPTDHQISLFAYSFSRAYCENGWNVYDPIAEYRRMGIVRNF